MATEKTITVKGDREDGGELTISRLRQFLEEFDKAAQDTAGTYPGTLDTLKPKVRVSFGGRLKSITAKVQG